MFAQQKTLEGGCGMGYIYRFENNGYRFNFVTRQNERLPAGSFNVSVGGTGMFTACFVSTPACKKMYNELTSKYRLVFQTAKRRNSNSGRQFITCIFDRKDDDAAKTEMPSLKPDWPFGKRKKKVIEPVVEDKTLD